MSTSSVYDTEMEATIAARQKLDYQQSESESVLKVRLKAPIRSHIELTRDLRIL